jgi:hypothetical protein
MLAFAGDLAVPSFGPRMVCLPRNRSALPPKADMCSAQADVRFGPIADIARSAKAKEAANWAAK